MHTRASNSELVEALPEHPRIATDRVVASTPGSAITIPEIANELLIKEPFDSRQGNPFDGKQTDSHKHIHEFLEICDMFKYRDTKNKAVRLKTVAFTDEGNSNTDTDKIMARMDAMTIKMDAQYKELQSRAKQPTLDLDDDDMPMFL
ncbi:hypothetical protein Tco_0842058 [Tanacetum coccineum]|uniref:Reverse transcriptase domain-containing protein n=1 Tax=Tanacetum coccineum TaxID=301880 RepID=A0ABQ5AY71_9ASTR